MGTPQKQFFEQPDLRSQCFLISVDILESNILTEFGGTTPWEPPKTNCLNDLIYGASVFLYQ